MRLFLGKFKPLATHNYQRVLWVFLFFFAVLSLIYFPLDRFVSHDDGFFHIRFAELTRTQGWGIFSNFPWLPFSEMAPPQTHFIYYNFLFYLFLIPFTFITPLFLGLKMASVTIGALVFTIFYYVLHKLMGRGAFWWTIAAFALIGQGETMRTIIGRPFALAPVLLLLLLYFLHRKKYVSTVLVTVVYFYWHSATFFFPLFISIIYIVFEKFYRRKPGWRNLAAVGLGTLATVLVTAKAAPGFFAHFYQVVILAVYETILRKTVPIPTGSELYPSDPFNFLSSHQILISLLIVASVWEIYQYIRWKKESVDPAIDSRAERPLQSCLFVLSTGALLFTFFSYRNADFFVFFAMVYVALATTRFFATSGLFPSHQTIVKLGLVIAIVYLAVGKGLLVQSAISHTSPYYSIERAIEWLKENVPTNSIIFNADWSDFPRLFFYNPNNYYVAGIDPRFLYEHNSRLYWQWLHITRDGYVCAEVECPELQAKRDQAIKDLEIRQDWNEKQGNAVAAVLKKDFGSKHILTSIHHPKLNNLLNNNGLFEKKYGDLDQGPFFIYQIK